MTKKVTRPRKSGFHFEQLPVAEVVRKIDPDGTANGRKNRIDGRTAEPPSRRPGRSGHFHGVQFYNDPDALCRIVAGFVGEGLEEGALALLIATPEHAGRIESGLRTREIDVDEQKRDGRLVILDAHQTLQLCMADGMPDSSAFRRVVSSALAHVRRGREDCAVRAYGEMVDLLWKDGLESAAIRLETLWNQLGTTHDFELMCGYSMGNFYKGTAVEAIHGQHSHLIATNGDASGLPDLRESATPP